MLPGLFITGNDTGVGKTYAASLIARALVAHRRTVGVYKPIASGCRDAGGTLFSDDAVMLWEAAGRPGDLERVCPQRFAAPLAPHLAARAAGKRIDAALLRTGLDYWRERAEIVIVEGIGGLMSPVGEDEYVADLAAEFGYPLVVVARNALGAINQTLQTLIVAATFREGLPVAGIVLNHPTAPDDDPSIDSNRDELSRRAVPPVLAEVGWQAKEFDRAVDWFALASAQ
ncbi:MAG TPA: dethiobiotin synthase [Pirellulales bacterium]|jgi:dethiobiotin synthetase|nr:dethiobiotin synthase [Pirellulales bacterium]